MWGRAPTPPRTAGQRSSSPRGVHFPVRRRASWSPGRLGASCAPVTRARAPRSPRPHPGAGPAGRGGCAPHGGSAPASGLPSRCRPAGGVGAQPPQKETPRGGGPEPRAARAPPGCGRGGRSPSQQTCACLGAAVALPSRRGRGGAAPTDRNSEGGRVGQSRAQRVLLRDGGVGGAAPRNRHAPASGPQLRCRPAGGVGAQPPQKETPRGGGPEPRAARAPPGWERGGRSPPQGTRAYLGPALALPTRWGRGGAAPTERNSEGGWAGQSRAQRVLLRDGGRGAQPPAGDARLPRTRGCTADPPGAWGRSPHRWKLRGRVGGPEPRAARSLRATARR